MRLSEASSKASCSISAPLRAAAAVGVLACLQPAAVAVLRAAADGACAGRMLLVLGMPLPAGAAAPANRLPVAAESSTSRPSCFATCCCCSTRAMCCVSRHLRGMAPIHATSRHVRTCNADGFCSRGMLCLCASSTHKPHSPGAARRMLGCKPPVLGGQEPGAVVMPGSSQGPPRRCCTAAAAAAVAARTAAASAVQPGADDAAPAAAARRGAAAIAAAAAANTCSHTGLMSRRSGRCCCHDMAGAATAAAAAWCANIH